MSYAVAEQPVTIAEYEAFMERQPHDTRWELVDGHVLAMTNPSEDHGQIVANIGVALRQAPGASGCRVSFGGLRVQATDDKTGVTATIPDVIVRSGERVGRNWITDPVIVVEVLSPSTMDFDRGAKLEFYKALPTVQDIVLAYQDDIRVEHYRRDGEGWAMTPLTTLAATLAFDSLPAALSLAEIYDGTGVA